MSSLKQPKVFIKLDNIINFNIVDFFSQVACDLNTTVNAVNTTDMKYSPSDEACYYPLVGYHSFCNNQFLDL